MKVNEGLDTHRDPRELTFSQAQGYEELPRPLKLEELPSNARTQIWNAFYSSIDASVQRNEYGVFVAGGWRDILYAKHVWYDNLPIDEWDTSFEDLTHGIRRSIAALPFNQVFDLIQFVLRQPKCPPYLVDMMKGAFVFSRLAYVIDETPPPTIIPAVTDAEGNTIIESLQTLRQAGLDGSASHLRKASEGINGNDWAGSIRESIHAVESVARQLDPEASKTLRPALASLEKRETLHPALKEAFNRLYGYTSDEQGVRHALLHQANPNVGMDEAVFMLGACASFASYLWRKHAAGGAP